MERFLSNNAILIYESISAVIMFILTVWLSRKNRIMKKNQEEQAEKNKMNQLKNSLSNRYK